MDSSLKRREHEEDEQEQEQQHHHNHQHHHHQPPRPLTPNSQKPEEEKSPHSASGGDPLVSPCKRLRLDDDIAVETADTLEKEEKKEEDCTNDKNNHPQAHSVDATTSTTITTITSTTIISSTSCCSVSLEAIYYNTPEKTRRDGGGVYHEESVNPYNSTLEKSEQQLTEEEGEASAMSSLGHPELSQDQDQDQSRDGGNMYWQSEPPRDVVLLCSPVKALTFHVERGEEEDEEGDGASLVSPQQTMPHNTPERSVILDEDDDSDGEIFINSPQQLSCAIPEVGTSITFADRTNLDGVRPATGGDEEEQEQDMQQCVPQQEGKEEESVTFIDKTNAEGAQRVAHVPVRAPADPEHNNRLAGKTREDRAVRTLPRTRLFSQPDTLPAAAAISEAPPLRSLPATTTTTTDGLGPRGQLHQQQQQQLLYPQQRHRFASVGDLCAQEMDHHRLTLQSYGSLAHFQAPRYPPSQPVFTRSASMRPLSHQPYPQPGNAAAPLPNERLVDYGSIDGPGGLTSVGNVNPNTMDYGSIDGPVGLNGVGNFIPRTVEYGSLDRRAGLTHPMAVITYGGVKGGPGPQGGVMSGAPPPSRQVQSAVDSEGGGGPGRLWFYGSVDDPQRVARPAQPPEQQQQMALRDQPFVREASRRTLPRLVSGSGGGDRMESGHHLTDTGHHLPQAHHHHHLNLHPQDPRSIPQFVNPHVQERREVFQQQGYNAQAGDGDHLHHTANKGTSCMMPGGHPQDSNNGQQYPGTGGGGGPSYGSVGQDPALHHPPPHPYHVLSGRVSGSSGSHADVQSRSQGSSQGRPESLPRSDRSGEHPAQQGSWGGGGAPQRNSWTSSQEGRSVGSQDSRDRDRDRSGDSRGSRGFSAADVARAENSKKRRILETPGQVRIAIYLNCGLVTVHVIEGRNFTCNWKPACDSYIKLSLIPEEYGRKLRLKSKPVPNTNNPFFDEKFSLELQKSDEDKRLLVSIWHKDLQSGCSEFMGCTSFGVKGIRNHKDVQGWYYMLREDVGKKKHLQVATAPPPPARPPPRPRRAHSIPQINSDVRGLESVTIHVERGKNGFGFGLAGEFPVRVGRVDLASPAEEGGLKVGDFVIKVNGLNVSRSTVTSVARLIKKSGQILVIVVNRPYPSANAKPPPPPSAPAPTTAPQPAAAVKAPADQGLTLWRRPDHIYESIMDGTMPDRSEFGDDCDKENEVTIKTMEISSVSQPFTQDRVSASTPLVPSAMSRKMSDDDGKKLESVHRLLSLELDFIDFMKLGIQRYARPLKHCIFTAAQHSAVFQNIETLVNISEYHVQQIQDNAPSLYPESDDDSQSSDDRHFASAVAMIYYSKAHMFCKAHEAYASGLSEANLVLSEMRQSKEFQRFIKDPPLQPGQPSISAFIFRPLQHIKELSSVFHEIYIHTPGNSVDHNTLKQVTHVLQTSVVTISNMSNARVQSVTSLSSHTKSSCSGRGSSVSSAASSKVDSSSESGQCGAVRGGREAVRTSCVSLNTVRGVDREVMNMQDRLVFSRNVPVFQLCHEDRHIIYQGDVFFMHNNHWSKIQMTLLSDMVVLCHPEADGSLHVLCDPLHLSHISQIHASPQHATELVLTLIVPSPSTLAPHTHTHTQPPSSTTTQRLLLRTPSPQDLSTWCNLLTQRCSRHLKQQQQQEQEQQNHQHQIQQQLHESIDQQHCQDSVSATEGGEMSLCPPSPPNTTME